MRRVLFVALLAGCSFPEPAVTDEATDSSTSDSTVTDTRGDSAVTETSDGSGDTAVEEVADGGDSTVTEAGDTGDTATDSKSDGETSVTDSKSDTPSSCETGDTCDCDGDGDKKPGAGCGGNDCDDGDKRRNSKVTAFLDYSPAGTMPAHAGDWDCSGGVVREYTDNINCGSYLNASGCTQQGYKATAPPCGMTTTWVRCKAGPLTNCVEDATMTMTPVVKCK